MKRPVKYLETSVAQLMGLTEENCSARIGGYCYEYFGVYKHRMWYFSYAVFITESDGAKIKHLW